MTKAEKDRLNAVASLGCRICGCSPSQVHHVREYGETRKHSKTFGLCWLHHVGPMGIHHLGKKAWEKQFKGQTELLAEVDEILGRSE